jgi:hypothetical protein
MFIGREQAKFCLRISLNTVMFTLALDNSCAGCTLLYHSLLLL